MRCTQQEIGTLGTCTLAAAGPAEVVSAPLYLTTTDAWYRSGDRIRKIRK